MSRELGDDMEYRRDLGNGDEVCVMRMTYGKGRITIGQVGALYYEDCWCYGSVKAAVKAAEVWDGEGDPPDGWHRHPASGRRRPDGDPKKEYVAS